MHGDGLLSVVIPVYGSESCLESTVSELCETLDVHRNFEIVLVNDDSPDGVRTIIDRLCGEDERIRAIHLARNVGQHRATLRGFVATRGDVVVTVDDDGQNPPSAVLALASALHERDLDIVYGRFIQSEHTPVRRWASRLNRWISRLTLSNRGQIPITNVRALRGDFARWLGSIHSSYPYIDALVFRATSSIGDVPVEHRTRARGESTYSLLKLVSLWLSHLTSLTLLPLRLAVAGSFSVSMLAVVLGGGLMIRALIQQRAPEGWLSLFTSVSFFFAVLFLFLGIVSAYVGRMYVSMNEQFSVWERPVEEPSTPPGSGGGA